MNDFVLFFKLGLNHVLDLQAYDHILFLLVLAIPYSIKQWKNLLWLITMFTIGHTLTLSLAAYDILKVDAGLVEFLIPFTIFCTALYNLFSSGSIKENSKIALFLTFCFGWVHGLGFSYYLQILLADSDAKLIPLLEFSLGIEGAQVIITLSVLIIFTILNFLFKIVQRDWVLVISAIIIGIVLPMLSERFDPFLKALLN